MKSSRYAASTPERTTECIFSEPSASWPPDGEIVRFAVPFSLAAASSTVKLYAEFTGLTVSSEFPEAAITFAAPVSCDTIVAVTFIFPE